MLYVLSFLSHMISNENKISQTYNNLGDKLDVYPFLLIKEKVTSSFLNWIIAHMTYNNLAIDCLNRLIIFLLDVKLLY